MLEFLINPKKAEKKPWEMFFIGLLYSSLSILLANFIFAKNEIFNKYLSIFIILFTVMFCLPFVYYLILYEEKKDIKIKKERKILKEHGKAIFAFIFLFFGLTLGFAFFSFVLPRDIAKLNFESQMNTYCSINMPYDIKSCIDYLSEGKIYLLRPNFSFSLINRFFSIFINNLFVLFFCLFFSFVFGAGAIFIIAWNASVLGVAISSLAKTKNFGLAILHYSLHGIPEMAAYFVGALAGGIISASVIRHDYKSKEFWIILQDSIDLIIISILLLIIAALIEIFISPFI
ncbi:MAG: stage II sporulation protein M [Candidatus Pacearchaeota archaeon]